MEWGLARYWQPPGPALPERTRWRVALNATFGAGDCRVVSIYNWDNDLQNDADGQAGVRDFLASFQG